MDLRSLKCAVALADQAHFGRAASQLNITQPAFSQRIAALEDEIGHKLFIRHQGPVALTAAGEAFVRRARVAIDHAQAAKNDAKLAATGLSGSLHIGFTQIALYQTLPEVLCHFRQSFPDIHIELKEQISIHQEQKLASEDLDIGVVHPPLAFKELHTHYLEESRLLLALPSSYPQANAQSISLADCSGLPFILPPRNIGPVFYDGIIMACHQAGFTPTIIQEAAPMSTVIGLASAGIGAGFVTEGLSVIKRPGVTFLEVNGRLPTLSTAIAWKSGVSNPAIEHFIKTLESFTP